MFVVVLQVAVPLAGWLQSAVVQHPDDGMHVEPHFL